MRAARGGPIARCWWVLLAIVLWPMLLVSQSALGAILVHWRQLGSWPDAVSDVLRDLQASWWPSYAVAFCVAAALATLELECVRLVWLWNGARGVLLSRDRCPECGHGLAGLRLAESGEVLCPECARAVPAVSTWGEVAADDQQRAVFSPADTLLKRFWTRRRVVLTTRIVSIAAGIALVSLGGWWAAREWRIREQASLAAQERPGANAINALIRQWMPPPPLSQPSALDLAKQATTRYKAHIATFVELYKNEASDPNAFRPDATYVSSPPGADRTAPEDDNYRYSLLLMTRMRIAGLYDLIDQIPDASPWSDQPYRAPDGPPASVTTFSPLRSVARICAARMRMAADARDATEFCKAMRSGLAAARAAITVPTIIGWLTGYGIEGVILAQASASMTAHPDAAWVDAVADELARTPPTSLANTLRIDQLGWHDLLGWYFSDPSRVRKGLGAPELRNEFGVGLFDSISSAPGGVAPPHAPRLGTYSENRDALDTCFDWLRARIDVEPFQRAGFAATLSASSGLAIVDLQAPLLHDRFLQTVDRAALRRRVLRAVIELERYRLKHGEYPDSLDLLPADSTRDALRDPYSGKPFGYRRVDPVADAHGRHFLLWTVGLDGEDNGGWMNSPHDESALREADSDTDFVVNGPDR